MNPSAWREALPTVTPLSIVCLSRCDVPGLWRLSPRGRAPPDPSHQDRGSEEGRSKNVHSLDLEK
jgi:hypothetical protein